MSLKRIYELYQTMEREHAMISFKGVVNAELLNSVLSIMESKLYFGEASLKKRKKVYSVLVECLQNLYHHNEDLGVFDIKSNSKEYLSHSSILIISNTKEYYEVKTGNFVTKEKAIELEEKIKSINKLNKTELRDLYKSVLSEGQFTNKGTAGLGLIDVARKSGNKLEFDFLPIEDGSKFFCLNVKIN